MAEKKLKLCLVAPVPPPYGGIVTWVNLLNYYIEEKQSDISVQIINSSPNKGVADGRRLWDRVVISGLGMIEIKMRMAKLIKKNKPDVVHITTSGRLAIVRDIRLMKFLKSKKIPVIYHLHFGRFGEIAQANTREYKWMSRAISLATVTIAIDPTTFKAIKEYIPEAKSQFVPNSINVDSLPLRKQTVSKTIVYLGNVIRQKGVEELLGAWSNLEARFNDWTLKIIGPYDKNYLEKLKIKEGESRIVFEGEKEHEDAMDILNDSELFILPSYTEGFPYVVLEAMALGKAIIATDVGAIPEMLADECGLTIKPRDQGEIERAIERLILDKELRVKLGNNAYNRLNEKYEIQTVFKQYLSIWQASIFN